MPLAIVIALVVVVVVVYKIFTLIFMRNYSCTRIILTSFPIRFSHLRFPPCLGYTVYSTDISTLVYFTFMSQTSPSPSLYISISLLFPFHLFFPRNFLLHVLPSPPFSLSFPSPFHKVFDYDGEYNREADKLPIVF